MYKQIYSQDQQLDKDTTHGWIQWKGTNVCMDIDCSCGHHNHVDIDFFYAYQCPNCGKKFAVGQTVKFIELKTDEEQKYFNDYYSKDNIYDY